MWHETYGDPLLGVRCGPWTMSNDVASQGEEGARAHAHTHTDTHTLTHSRSVQLHLSAVCKHSLPAGERKKRKKKGAPHTVAHFPALFDLVVCCHLGIGVFLFFAPCTYTLLFFRCLFSSSFAPPSPPFSSIHPLFIQPHCSVPWIPVAITH